MSSQAADARGTPRDVARGLLRAVAHGPSRTARPAPDSALNTCQAADTGAVPRPLEAHER
jgi:hypothetical protein